jgi:hypothetical protein
MAAAEPAERVTVAIGKGTSYSKVLVQIDGAVVHIWKNDERLVTAPISSTLIEWKRGGQDRRQVRVSSRGRK